MGCMGSHDQKEKVLAKTCTRGSHRKELGAADLYVQDLEGKQFFIHCLKDADYACKIMSTHGLMVEQNNHKTFRFINHKWVSFNYCESMSQHNHSKHWVDDVTNSRHDPIGLEDAWATKWWPH
ncbi:hypothetical protein ACHAW6_016099 [Cyclotella cf. meneghiniana]